MNSQEILIFYADAKGNKVMESSLAYKIWGRKQQVLNPALFYIRPEHTGSSLLDF